MRALILRSVVAVVVVAAGSVRADCATQADSQADSVSILGDDTGWAGGASPEFAAQRLSVSANFTCAATGTSCTGSPRWGGTVWLAFAGAHDATIGVERTQRDAGCSPDLSLATTLDGTGGTMTCLFNGVMGGMHGVVGAQSGCYSSGATSLSNEVFSTQEFTTPPGMQEPDFIVAVSFKKKSDAPVIHGSPTDKTVPVGVPFRLAGAHVTPAGTDVVTFRIEGAGASFSRSYSADPNSPPRDLGYAWFQDTDDTSASYVTLTQPGSFQYWVELNGVKSKVLTFTAVTWLDGNPPASGAGGGSGANTGGGSGSSGDAPRSGCSSVGGALMLGALALLRRRR